MSHFRLYILAFENNNMGRFRASKANLIIEDVRLGKICVLIIVSRWYRQYKANAKRHICVDPSLLDKGRSARVQSAALTAGQRNREGLTTPLQQCSSWAPASLSSLLKEYSSEEEVPRFLHGYTPFQNHSREWSLHDVLRRAFLVNSSGTA